MSMMSYDRLQRVSRSTPPYRGTTNRFPLYTRRANTKYFLAREEDGQTVFDIVYGQRWETVELTEEQYFALSKHKAQRTVEQPENRYIQYVSKPNILGTVRRGNSERGEFQFNASRYGQGERMFLTGLFRGWFFTDSRRGGMLYRERATEVMYPIYAGMKVDAVTMKPLTPHEVVIHRVDRKKSKHLTKDYEHFFKVSEVMLKSLTLGAVIAAAKELLDEIGMVGSPLLQEAKVRLNTSPLDSFILYCMGHDIGRLVYRAKYSKSAYFYGSGEDVIAYDELFMNVKRRITKEIYIANPDVFKEIRYGCGKEYPTSDWGTSVVVNGLEMAQYK